MNIHSLALVPFCVLGVGCVAPVDRLGPAGPSTEPVDVSVVDNIPDAGCVPGQVWKPSSVHIDVRSGGFWEGPSGYRIDRSDMSQDQLQSLNGLCVLPGCPGDGAEDVSHYTVTISDSDGSSVEYRATSANVGVPSGTCEPALDVHTLKPFLTTYDCLTSGETRQRTSDSIGSEGEAPWASAPTLTTDPGCTNSVFLPCTCADVWLKFKVAKPGTYELRASRCLETIGIQLFTPEGALLANDSPTDQLYCRSLRYTFASPGTYLIDIQKTNSAGCSTSGMCGDMLLSVVSGG